MSAASEIVPIMPMPKPISSRLFPKITVDNKSQDHADGQYDVPGRLVLYSEEQESR